MQTLLVTIEMNFLSSKKLEQSAVYSTLTSPDCPELLAAKHQFWHHKRVLLETKIKLIDLMALDFFHMLTLIKTYNCGKKHLLKDSIFGNERYQIHIGFCHLLVTWRIDSHSI